MLANQAKDRGNECFKSGDYNNALKYYNVSLKLYATANAYNNRAMTCKLYIFNELLTVKRWRLEADIYKLVKLYLKRFPNLLLDLKLKNYEDALEDCNEVLKREQNNVKALHRRATAYQNLGGENNNEVHFNFFKIILDDAR